MAISIEEIKNSYPLPVYNYRVTVLTVSLSGMPLPTELAQLDELGAVIGCSEVSGLSMELETVTYKHGFSFLMGEHVIPAQRKEVRFSIKKGVTAQSRFFSDWIRLIYPVIVPKPASMFRKRDVLIDLLDEAGIPSVRWNVIKAMPTKLEAPTFDATTNEVAFERLELIGHQVTVDYGVGS